MDAAPQYPGYHVLKHGDSWYGYFTEIPPECKVDQDTFVRLWNLHPQDRGQGTLAGVEYEAARWQAVFGGTYSFGGVKYEGIPVSDPFHVQIINWVRKHSGLPYNGLVMNWYDGGKDTIGPHRDKEDGMLPGAPIYSFSYGITRDFHIKSIIKGEPGFNVPLPHNSLFIIGWEMNKHYKHSVPKRANLTGQRINITVRAFI